MKNSNENLNGRELVELKKKLNEAKEGELMGVKKELHNLKVKLVAKSDEGSLSGRIGYLYNVLSDGIISNLNKIPASEFILSKEQLKGKIGGLTKKIRENLVDKISVLELGAKTEIKASTSVASKVLKNEKPKVVKAFSSGDAGKFENTSLNKSTLQKSVKDQGHTENLAEASNNLKQLEDRTKWESVVESILKEQGKSLGKHAESILDAHTNVLHRSPTKSRLDRSLVIMRERLLDSANFDGVEEYEGGNIGSKIENLNKISKQISSFCNLARIWVRQKKYGPEATLTETCFAFSKWHEEFATALANLKRKYLTQNSISFYNSQLEAVQDMLTVDKLQKLFGDDRPFPDLKKMPVSGGGAILSRAAVFALPGTFCFVSRHYNIMPNINPLVTLGKEQANIVYSASVYMFSACLILYAARYATNKIVINAAEKKIDRLSSELQDAKIELSK